MGPQDDPEVFVYLFERTAEACGWARTQWSVRLIPLLTGEAQVAAQQLPVANLLAYDDLKRAILQRVGHTPEQHRERFRSRELGDSGRPFVLAQQLRDACRRWLLAEDHDVEGVVDLVILEQFITQLPRGTAEWVQCHRPTSLMQAIQLAEDHLVACPGGGEPLSILSLSSPSPSLPSPSRPFPAPRSWSNLSPRAPQRSGAFQGTDQGHGRVHGLLFHRPLSPLSTNLSAILLPLGWREGLGRPAGDAGDPDHFLDRCRMMEVGSLIWVPDSPPAAHDQARLYQIPMSFKGVHIRLWWIRAVTKPPFIKA